MLKRLDNHVIVGVLERLLTIGLIFTGLFRLEVSPQRADHVHVQTSDVVVVIANVLVLLVMLLLELFDCTVLLGLDLGDLGLAPSFHVLSQTGHLRLVLFLDFTCNALMLFSLLGGQGIIVLGESVTVLSLPHLLLFLLDFECAQVLLQLSLIDTVLVFAVLQLNLRLLLHHGLLVKVLEHEML